MRRTLAAALAGITVAVLAAGAPAQVSRDPMVALDQLAPATTIYDTTVAFTSATTDTFLFGFWSNYVFVMTRSAACSVAYVYDPNLQPTVTAATDTVWWYAGRKGLPRIPQTFSYLDAGESAYWPDRVPGVVLKGLGSGTFRVKAGTAGMPMVKGP